VKVDFPHFNAMEDPISWNFRTNQIFEVHQMLEDENVSLTSLSFGEDAQQRFQTMIQRVIINI
jgi:hypothetical protein